MKNAKLKIRKDIVERTYNFALCIVKFVRILPKETAGFELGRQLLKAGTSIAANVEEAQGAFSKEDFIYKMQTAFKEAREANFWLRLIRDSGVIKNEEFKIKNFDEEDLENLIRESEEIKNILASIVKTSKKNKNIF